MQKFARNFLQKITKNLQKITRHLFQKNYEKPSSKKLLEILSKKFVRNLPQNITRNLQKMTRNILQKATRHLFQ